MFEYCTTSESIGYSGGHFDGAPDPQPPSMTDNWELISSAVAPAYEYSSPVVLWFWRRPIAAAEAGKGAGDG